MSCYVASVTENTRETTAEARVEGVLVQGVISRVFDVILGENSDPVEAPIFVQDLCGAFDGVIIPALRDPHPFDEWTWCCRKSIRYNGNLRYILTCDYTSEDPLNEPWEISWLFNTVNEPIDKDINDIPITNSAGETFDPPITEDKDDLVYRCIKNQSEFDPLWAADMKGAINEDYFFGFPPGACRLKTLEAQELYSGLQIYYRVTYEVYIRYDKDHPEAATWKRKFLDQGFRIKTGTDDAGKPTYEIMKDDAGQPLSQPVMLDGAGGKLADKAAAVFVEFTTVKTRQFNANLDIIKLA